MRFPRRERILALVHIDASRPLDEARETMRLVIRDADRAGDVIAHSRALVKKSGGEESLVDVDQMTREVLSLVQPEVQKHGVVADEALAEGVFVRAGGGTSHYCRRGGAALRGGPAGGP